MPLRRGDFLLPHTRKKHPTNVGQKGEGLLLFHVFTLIHIANHVYEATPLGVKLLSPLDRPFHGKASLCGRAFHFIELGREGEVVFFSHCCFIFLYSIRCQTLVLAGR